MPRLLRCREQIPDGDVRPRAAAVMLHGVGLKLHFGQESPAHRGEERADLRVGALESLEGVFAGGRVPHHGGQSVHRVGQGTVRGTLLALLAPGRQGGAVTVDGKDACNGHVTGSRHVSEPALSVGDVAHQGVHGNSRLSNHRCDVHVAGIHVFGGVEQ